MGNTFKIRLFISFIILLFISAIMMSVFLGMGAEGAGEMVKWFGIGVSLVFMLVAGFLAKS
jgi:hypothetical protein